MNDNADLEEELFNLILSDKITVFDLNYGCRSAFPELYVAEFRKTRYFPERHKESLQRLKNDIDNTKDNGLKAELFNLYVTYKEPYSEPDK